MRLEGKRIVVTGSSGMAADGARRFHQEGASVFIVDLEPDRSASLADELGGAGWRPADLRDESATEEAFAAAKGQMGGVDGLYAVAGGSGRRHGDGPVHEIPLSGWEATIDTNLTTSFLSLREALRAMADEPQGSIVMMSSVVAISPSPNHFATHAYAAAKGAENALVKAAAAYYAPRRIRINAIAPGLVMTPMSERATGDPVILDHLTRKQPLTVGPLSPGDVTAAAVYLLSDESSAVTGQVIAVDGGWSVTEG